MLLTSFVLAGISCKQPTCEGVKGPPSFVPAAEYPLAGVQVRSSDIVFYPAPSVAWSSLVDLSLFDGFWPGITGRQARASVGEPDEESTTSLGSHWIFLRTKGTVELRHEDDSSLPFIMPRRWKLSGVPLDSSPAALLHPALLARIPTNGNKWNVVIMNNCGYPAAQIFIRQGQIERILWINNPGSSLAPSRSRPEKTNDDATLSTGDAG